MNPNQVFDAGYFDFLFDVNNFPLNTEGLLRNIGQKEISDDMKSILVEFAFHRT